MRAEATDFAVREARSSDAPRVVELMEQLGYRATVEQVAERLGMCGHQRQVFVAVDEKGRIAGWIAISLPIYLIAGMRAEIEGLIVDANRRELGAGRALIERAERWARKNGCATMRLLSNVGRERAHAFYERHGYSTIKTEHVFEKSL